MESGEYKCNINLHFTEYINYLTSTHVVYNILYSIFIHKSQQDI